MGAVALQLFRSGTQGGPHPPAPSPTSGEGESGAALLLLLRAPLHLLERGGRFAAGVR